MTIIAFLGTGRYEPANYQLNNQQYLSQYIQIALAKIKQVNRIELLITEAAREKHATNLIKEATDLGIEVQLTAIPDGKNQDDFWQIFQAFSNAVGQTEHAIIDITHGFRSLPFFAAAAIQYLAASNKLPSQVELYYGLFEPNQTDQQIIDLAPFLDLMQWSSAIQALVQHGSSAPLDQLASASERAQRKQWAVEKDMDKLHTTRLKPLIQSLQAFGEAINTVRIPHITSPTAYEHQSPPQQGHAQALLTQIDVCRNDIQAYMPPLAGLLDDLGATVLPLCADNLTSENALMAQKSLAELYLKWHRIAEASIVLRETTVTQYADSETTALSNRTQQEDQWFDHDINSQQTISRLRNDIQHGGWRSNAVSGKSLKQDLTTKLAQFSPKPLHASADQKHTGNTYIVSRHQGAIQWLQRQGYEQAIVIDHLDSKLLKPGDSVIGNLPLNVIAELTSSRIDYLHLDVTLPAELRGVELSLEQLEQCNPRLVHYNVRASHN